MRTLTPGFMHFGRVMTVLAGIAVASGTAAAAAAGDTGDAPGAAQPAAAAQAQPPAAPRHDSAVTRDPAIAATLDGTPISLEAVDQRIAAQLLRLRQEQYELRAQALDAMLDQQVVEREARAQHVNPEQLIEQRVTAKIALATPAEIDTFYVHNRGQMAGRTLEQSSASIAAALKTNRLASSRAEYVRTLRKRYAAHVLLEPPRFAASPDDDPSRGAASAPITIVEFSDFQCPFCTRAEDTINEVLAKYGDRVRLVFRDFPLSIHPFAEGAAIAGDCAREQGKYWEMNRAMYANQAKLSTTDLASTAGSIGLDVERFKACMASPESHAEVAKDMAEGQALGISGTPTFFINGVMIVGARELEVFTRTIDRELERLGQSR